MVLANALYFKGAWAGKFEDSATQPATFFANGKQGEQRHVPTMKATREERCAHVSEDSVRVLELRYAGDELSMLFVLPNAVHGLPQLERSRVFE